MSTVGILGGGQLARMLALAGAPLGLRFLIVDSNEDACAGQVAPLIHANFVDIPALESFASRIDVATFDFENIPAMTGQWLCTRTRVFPNPAALAVAQDRLAEKSVFRELGLATPNYVAVASRSDLERAVEEIGLPAILKTRRLGYDGKGQYRLREPADIEKAYALLGGVPLILEAFVPFDREVSVVAVRGRDGEFRSYPLTENWHEEGVLSASLAPAPSATSIAAYGAAYAQALADRLDYVGVFALELFEKQGQLLANEMAPRVHNSGHWTLEGAPISQFENHLRAVMGLPLGETRALGPTAMLNWIGRLPDAKPVLSEARGHWHDYGKTPRAGRKVGHATFCASDNAELAACLERVGAALDRTAQVAPVIAALARRS